MAITTNATAITFSDATVQTTAYTTGGGPVPAGSVMLFYQSGAPTGWTQVTTQNNKALRVVSGTGGVAGGTTAFTSVFANQTPTITTSGLSAGSTTLSTTQIPSHSHTVRVGPDAIQPLSSSNWIAESTAGSGLGQNSGSVYNTTMIQNTGGGGSHSHSISGSATSSAITLNVQYIDIILASKD